MHAACPDENPHPPIPWVDVAGIRVAVLERPAFGELVCDHARSGRPLSVGYLNAHGSNLAARHPEFRRALESLDLVLCDSKGLQLGCLLLGRRAPPSITSTPDLYGFPELFARLGVRPFLLGSRPGVAEESARRLQADFPGLRIAGTHHGFFQRWGEANTRVVEAVNASGAQVLFVGLGMPRQELWIQANRAALRTPVVIATGAAFEWLAGRVTPVPRLVRDAGLEWSWRLAHSPRHLAKRYLLGNPLFVARMLAHRALEGAWR